MSNKPMNNKKSALEKFQLFFEEPVNAGPVHNRLRRAK